MLAPTTLQSIHALHDLPRLVAALGHDPLWEPLEHGTLDLGRLPEAPAEAAIVGRLGDFTWYGIMTAEPERTTSRVARRLAERGRICGVFGLASKPRQLGVSIALETAPVLLVDLEAPDRLATSCLGRIGNSEAGGVLGIASRAVDALQGESVGRHFFRAFRGTLDRFIGALPPHIPARHRHELALLQLTRVLFLYFVQAKGWLNGSDQFLRDQVNEALFHRSNLHRSVFLPLFFGSLNRPLSARRPRAKRFGRIPFLNGGLFEPHRLERLHHPTIPDSTWRDAFDTLFERYHFTTGESGSPGSIAPDMLGRVFEGVMEPAVRKRSGTYYTPAHLVRSVVDAALAGFVGRRLQISDTEAVARLDQGDRGTVAALEDITILDPAVGSGAFLLGAFERLASLREAAGLPVSAREIVMKNLHGVDHNPAAIQLCELRLWLAVISREPDGAPEHVAPLPNLDTTVRQGDSLSDPLRLMLRHPLRASRHISALASARAVAAAASGPTKQDAIRQLRAAELRVAADRLETAVIHKESEVSALLESGRSLLLFGGRRGLDRSGRRALQRARKDLKALRGALRQLVTEGVAPSFDFDTQFGDVMGRGGFDLVIGNPPWVRAEGLDPATRAALRERFTWWRSGARRGYGHQPDLAVAFLERGWELTRPGGVMAMLVPAKIATAEYGTVARTALQERGTLLVLADLTREPAAAFDATTYPLCIIARNERPSADHRPRLALHPSEARAPGRAAVPGAPWVLTDGRLERVLGEVARHPPLSQTLPIRLGVKTGANHLFLTTSPGVEAELLRPALRGRDVGAFRAIPSRQIIWTHDDAGAPLERLPPGASRHFGRHVDALRRRADDAGGPPWSLFRAAAGRPIPRVVWADISTRLEVACLVDPPARACVPLNSCYTACPANRDQALALCAWLNSTWIRAIARAIADPASGGYARFNARTVGAVPLPPDMLDHPELRSLARRGAAGQPVQRILDELVGEAIGLSTRSRRVLGEVVGVGAARRR